MEHLREARDDDRRLKVQKRLVPLNQKLHNVSENASADYHNFITKANRKNRY